VAARRNKAKGLAHAALRLTDLAQVVMQLGVQRPLFQRGGIAGIGLVQVASQARLIAAQPQ
jgi:hypothetical protein